MKKAKSAFIMAVVIIMQPAVSVAAGYELYFNNQRVSGPDADYYTLQQAQDNCQFNMQSKPNMAIRCVCMTVKLFPNVRRLRLAQVMSCISMEIEYPGQMLLIILLNRLRKIASGMFRLREIWQFAVCITERHFTITMKSPGLTPVRQAKVAVIRLKKMPA